MRAGNSGALFFSQFQVSSSVTPHTHTTYFIGDGHTHTAATTMSVQDCVGRARWTTTRNMILGSYLGNTLTARGTRSGREKHTTLTTCNEHSTQTLTHTVRTTVYSTDMDSYGMCAPHAPPLISCAGRHSYPVKAACFVLKRHRAPAAAAFCMEVGLIRGGDDGDVGGEPARRAPRFGERGEPERERDRRCARAADVRAWCVVVACTSRVIRCAFATIANGNASRESSSMRCMRRACARSRASA